MKTLIKEFKKLKTLEIYSKIIDKLYPNARKCIECGNHIFYHDTNFRIKRNNTIEIIGKSFLTKKKHGDALNICEHCLKNKFNDYDNVNKSRIFNTLNKFTLYAFNIKNKPLYKTGLLKN